MASNRLTNTVKGIPHALHMERNSIKSSRRSPDSYLLTID